jgi:hypothetical protein
MVRVRARSYAARIRQSTSMPSFFVCRGRVPKRKHAAASSSVARLRAVSSREPTQRAPRDQSEGSAHFADGLHSFQPTQTVRSYVHIDFGAKTCVRRG